ncbi:MAG TPA: hypothetical protein VI454_20940 [Verrucomicrobiae bacterium]|jgi:hypothetical protein
MEITSRIYSTLRKRSPSRERAMAVLAVMLLLVALAAFVAANGLALRSLQRELRLVEKEQLKKWTAAPTTATNAPASARR